MSVAITNDGQLGFVALSGGKVSMIDLLERRGVYTVSVSGTPRFIITGLFPPDFSPTPTGPAKTAPTPVQQATGSSVLPKIVFPVLAIIILARAFFLAWQIRIFLRSNGKSK